jgi:hypothetical protein
MQMEEMWGHLTSNLAIRKNDMAPLTSLNIYGGRDSTPFDDIVLLATQYQWLWWIFWHILLCTHISPIYVICIRYFFWAFWQNFAQQKELIWLNLKSS